MTKKTKYSIIEESDEIIIRTDDGGVASIFYNGEAFITEYYQNRCKKNTPDWEELSKGKKYIKEWDIKDHVTEEMIYDALNWLVIFNDGFEKVNKLVFNNVFKREHEKE